MNLVNKYTILAVDNDKRVLSTIQTVFDAEIQDYNVITAANSQQAHFLIKMAKPDLILLDWKIELEENSLPAAPFKRIDESTDIPVILLTSSKYFTKFETSGAIDFIRKPIDRAELITRVKSTLSIFKLVKEILIQSRTLEQQSKLLEEQKRSLEKEKMKSDTLLLNILPYEIAEQLKLKGKVDAKHYKMASVLFTDFQGFTKISEQIHPEEIIRELGVYFERFDEIISKHYIEKIKTIGDSYMCVGGLPLRNKSNPIDTVLAGLKMQKFVIDYNKIKKSLNQTPWNLRVGIHTGNVIAGVIGKKKFAYDIWGDAVNTASRMESSGEPGKVNISGETYKYIKEFFICEYRGKVMAKSKGEVDMYFVEGLKPEFCSGRDNVTPNQRFLEILSEL